MSFKQFCSPVAAITGPWNCVVYRDIRLLKAHSYSRHFSSDAALKRSSGCGFVLTYVILCVRPAPSAPSISTQ